jgi:predicted secreted protein
MSTRRRVVAARLAVGLALAPGVSVAVAAEGSASAPAAKVTTIKDNGTKNVRHWIGHVGHGIAIVYSECGTCGYAWRVILKPNHAVRVTSKQTAPHNPPGYVGGSGTRTFTFVARALGKTTAKLGYFGPGSSHPSRIVIITFDVIK